MCHGIISVTPSETSQSLVLTDCVLVRSRPWVPSSRRWGDVYSLGDVWQVLCVYGGSLTDLIFIQFLLYDHLRNLMTMIRRRNVCLSSFSGASWQLIKIGGYFIRVVPSYLDLAYSVSLAVMPCCVLTLGILPCFTVCGVVVDVLNCWSRSEVQIPDRAEIWPERFLCMSQLSCNDYSDHKLSVGRGNGEGGLGSRPSRF